VTASCTYTSPLSLSVAPGGLWFSVVLNAAGQAAVPSGSSTFDASVVAARALAGGVTVAPSSLLDDTALTLTVPSSLDAGLIVSEGNVSGVRPSSFAASASLSVAAVIASLTRPAAAGYTFDILMLGGGGGGGSGLRTVTLRVAAGTLQQPGAGSLPGTTSGSALTSAASAVNSYDLVRTVFYSPPPAGSPRGALFPNVTFFQATITLTGVSVTTLGGGAGIATIEANIAAALGISPSRVTIIALQPGDSGSGSSRRLRGRELATGESVSPTVQVSVARLQ
jgi:hypothetical protein